MPILDSLYFSYAGEKSIEHGIIHVTLNSGMLEEPFAASRNILETSTRGRDKPYFQGTQKQPLQFDVSFAFEDRWEQSKIQKVVRWLTEQDQYQELFFANEQGNSIEKIYYALVVNEPRLVHNALQQGYVNLTFRCDSPYAYSPILLSPLYKVNQNTYIEEISRFDGSKKNLVLDADGKLVLNPHRTKWNDYPSTWTWAELDQSKT